jgi:hypothetical protein
MSTITSPGCVIFLVDESEGMGTIMKDEVAGGKRSTKSNAELVATALNSALNQLASGPECDVAVVGYQTDAAGQTNVGCRWGGALAGKEFVSTRELSAAPLKVETRSRKVPAPGGVLREEPISFPVWYAPTLGAKSPQIAAFEFCRDLLSRWLAAAGPSAGVPLLVHVFAGASGDGNPQKAIDKLLEIPSPAGPPLLLQAHIASTAKAVASLYPSSHVYLTVGSARDVFKRTSPLPPNLVIALNKVNVSVSVGARGMLYNAKIADIIRLFSLVKAHVQDGGAKAEQTGTPAQPSQPAQTSAPEAPQTTLSEARAGDKTGLVVFLLDRSVQDPFAGNVHNACAKLQDNANDLLKQISGLKETSIDAAIVSYGLDSAGQLEVRHAFDGPLAGKSIVSRAELADGAIRTDEFEEEISNGMGGLTKMTRKKLTFFDLEPTAAAPAASAFQAVAQIIDEWCAQHGAACLPPVVLHLTRGAGDVAELEQAVVPLRAINTSAGQVALYHLVITESPQPSLAYPDTESGIDDPVLRKLWEYSSPLLGAERLSGERKTVKPGSRGIVINGKFDLLLDEAKHALT